jgi:ribosomal protein S11
MMTKAFGVLVAALCVAGSGGGWCSSARALRPTVREMRDVQLPFPDRVGHRRRTLGDRMRWFVVTAVVLASAGACGSHGAASGTTAPPAYVQAADVAAQSNLRSGIAAAKVVFTEGSYATFTASMATSIEPSLGWQDAGVDPGAGDNTITIQFVSSTSLELIAKSAFGRYFCITDTSPGPGVAYGAGDTFASVAGMAACAGGW